ncbi:unnamed protein product [Prunus armeniaca]|uniref:Uncharacterized protein n=1 Tax=Prunus armeniaca TaxID=36596 RepID=A0A6J5UQT2_PRUAR|nr:unnamed protein product [Prunus armeniaca]
MGKYGVALNTELLGTPSHKQRQCEACHAQASRHGHGRLVVPCHIQDLPKMKRRGLSNKVRTSCAKHVQSLSTTL